MPRVNVIAGEAEKAVSDLLRELAINKVDAPSPTLRHMFPGRKRFLRQSWVRRQMWRTHTANIMENFDKLQASREEIRRRLSQTGK